MWNTLHTHTALIPSPWELCVAGTSEKGAHCTAGKCRLGLELSSAINLIFVTPVALSLPPMTWLLACSSPWDGLSRCGLHFKETKLRAMRGLGEVKVAEGKRQSPACRWILLPRAAVPDPHSLKP